MASNTSSVISTNSSSILPITLDFSNFTRVISVKSKGTNYLMWLPQLIPVLCSNDRLGIVDGSESCPTKLICDAQEEVVNPEYTIWVKKDQNLLGWINFTLYEKVLAITYGLNTSKQV